MKFQSVKKIMAIVLSLAIISSFAAISASAADTEYVPNRSITMNNESEAAPTLKFSVLPFDLGENGPYHLFAKMKIEDFGAIDSSKDAAVSLKLKYGNYDDGGSLKVPDKTSEVRWTANTDGWVDMIMPDGKHIKIENFDTDLIIDFVMVNAKGKFTFADFIIADKENKIVYSLANDPGLSGVSNLGGSVSGTCFWTSSINKSITAISMYTKPYNYTPNRVLSIEIPHTFPETDPTPQNNPESNAYCILDMGNAVFPADKGPFTIQAMFKVEDFGVSTYADHAWITDNASFFIQDSGIRPLRGNTGGWIPFVKLDGTPYTFDSSAGWVNIMGSWGTTGKMSIADLVVYDKDGNVAYSFETDQTLQAGTIPWRSTINNGTILAWAYFLGLGSYTYTVSDSPVTHTADDYKLHEFSETYVPYEEPATTTKSDGTTTTTSNTTKNPSTGAGFPIAASMLALGSFCATPFLIGTKRKNK